jgi:hypothetical protein
MIMGCHHEIKSGGVITVVNARGLLGGCSFCKQEALEKENETLRSALRAVYEACLPARTVRAGEVERICSRLGLPATVLLPTDRQVKP